MSTLISAGLAQPGFMVQKGKSHSDFLFKSQQTGRSQMGERRTLDGDMGAEQVRRVKVEKSKGVPNEPQLPPPPPSPRP